MDWNKYHRLFRVFTLCNTCCDQNTAKICFFFSFLINAIGLIATIQYMQLIFYLYTFALIEPCIRTTFLYTDNTEKGHLLKVANLGSHALKKFSKDVSTLKRSISVTLCSSVFLIGQLKLFNMQTDVSFLSVYNDHNTISRVVVLP